jgi:integrase
VHHPRPDVRSAVVRCGRPDRLAPKPVFAAVCAISLRHAPRSKFARGGVPLNVIQRQLGRADLGITSIYRQGIDNAEITETLPARRAPMLPAGAGLPWHG